MRKEYHIPSLEGEVWKSVHSLKDRYAVSNYGRLKAYSRSYIDCLGRFFYVKERLLKIWKDKMGYMAFRPTVDGKLLSAKIHRLVAEAFISNPLNLPYINHKDENPTNNHVENLEWCTAKYNTNYGTCQERHSNSLKAVLHPKSFRIRQYSPSGELLHTYIGKAEMEKAGFVYTTVTRSCRHQVELSQGYEWRYDDDPFTPPSSKARKRHSKKQSCQTL